MVLRVSRRARTQGERLRALGGRKIIESAKTRDEDKSAGLTHVVVQNLSGDMGWLLGSAILEE